MPGKNELAVVENFALALPDKQEIMEIMAENMEGVDFRCERVKIPSGGGIAWEVPNEDGEPDTVKEITGVIIDHHPANGWWKEEYSGEANPPDCYSMDGITGIGNPGGKCATCPLNQFGSATKGKGKACKNMRRIYILRENEVFPLFITVPPTSLGSFKDYSRRLTNRLRRITGVLTKLTLEKDKNDDGIVYSKVAFSRVGDLPKEQAAAIAGHASVLKPHLRQIGLTDEDYNVPETSGDDVGDFAGATIDVSAGSAWD